jgi:radical SAM protein with 4Fe4S-binding SPASM domain
MMLSLQRTPTLLQKWVPDFTEEDIAATAAQPAALLTMELELTRACNLVCKYCYASSGRPLKGELSYSELTQAVSQAAALGARRIVILGGGEPLLYPQLRSLIAHIRNLGLGVDVFTNGTLLTRDWADFFYVHQVSVNVKYNSNDAEVQDFLAGRPGTFGAIQEALAYLHQAGYPDSEHRLGVETIICRQNLLDLPEIWRWARQHHYIPYVEMMTPQGRAQEFPILDVTPDEALSVFQAIQKIDREEFGYDWPLTPPLVGATCRRHLYSCMVDSLGNVSPCPGVDIKTGNLRERSLEEILSNSVVFRELRQIHEKISGPCRTCKHHAVCYGCRGAAYNLTHDYLASDPLCWKVKK